MRTDLEIQRLETVPYLAGLPLVSEPELTGQERAEIWRIAWLGLAGSLSLIIGATAIDLLVFFLATKVSGGAIVAPLSMTLCSIGLLFLLTGLVHRLLLFASLARDAIRGYVYEFCGPRNPSTALFQRMDLVGSPDPLLRIECLPNARMLWRADGIRRMPLAPAHWVTLAWPAPLAAVGHFGDKRRLAPAEQRELNKYVRESLARSFVFLLIQIGTTLGIISAVVTHASIRGFWDVAHCLETGGTFAALGALLVNSCRQTVLLSRDAHQGFANVYEKQVEGESEAKPAPEVSESLPFTGLSWTFNGVPAAWRGRHLGLVRYETRVTTHGPGNS